MEIFSSTSAVAPSNGVDIRTGELFEMVTRFFGGGIR